MEHVTRRTHGHGPALPPVTQAFLAFAAAFGIGAVAAYQACALLATKVGTVASLPLGLLIFIIVSAIALVLAARLDAGYLSR